MIGKMISNEGRGYVHTFELSNNPAARRETGFLGREHVEHNRASIIVIDLVNQKMD